MSQQTAEFGKWRSFFWPIHTFELKKVLPMFFIMFFISFNYTILRDAKDTIVVTAPGSGAEAIPFLKVWGVVPCAILFMIIYSKLANVLSKPKLFYFTLLPFLGFFALFATVLYPLRESLHPHAFADMLQANLPEGFKGLIAIIRNWTFSLFYIMSELWGSVALSLLFWGFANDITKVKEAKRFYAVFLIGANVALLFSGPIITLVAGLPAKLGNTVSDPWQLSLNILMSMVVVSGLIVMAIYKWTQSNVLTDERFYDQNEQKKAKKEKPKMSLGESFKFLAKSKYILCIAVLVIAYGIAINIVEVTWKNQLKQQFTTPNEYMGFMGSFSFFTGLTTIAILFFLSSNVIRRFGWRVGAMVTPLILLVTGVLFFSFILFRDQLGPLMAMIGTTPIFLAVIIGATQNILTKSSKYAFFDSTKEMAYIPLDQESKVKGKAAIDVVGARLGKSGGSLIQQGLIVTLGSIAAMTPFVAGILFFIIGGWVVAVNALNKRFLALTHEREKEEELESAQKEEEEPAAV